MPVNPNLARWVFASIMKHLEAVATAAGHPFIKEGVDVRTDAIMKSKLWAEGRVTGPYTRDLQGGEYEVNVDANVLLSTNQPGYDIVRVAGLYQEALSTPIPVWNYGALTGDYVHSDSSTKVLLGCLTNSPGRKEMVAVFHFGQVNKTDPIRQSVIDTSLQMIFPSA